MLPKQPRILAKIAESQLRNTWIVRRVRLELRVDLFQLSNMLSYELGHECSLTVIFDESCQLPFDVIVIVQDRIVEVIIIFLPFGKDAAVLLEASDVGLLGARLDVGRQWLLSDANDAGLYCLFNCCFIKFILLGNQKAVLPRLEEDWVNVHRFFPCSCLQSIF